MKNKKCLHQQAAPIQASGRIRPSLFTQAQLFNQRKITVQTFRLQIIEQSAAAADHFQQTAAAMMIFICVLKWAINTLIRVVNNAICTSGEPVSLALHANCMMMSDFF
jgi:hypothetical protein